MSAPQKYNGVFDRKELDQKPIYPMQGFNKTQYYSNNQILQNNRINTPNSTHTITNIKQQKNIIISDLQYPSIPSCLPPIRSDIKIINYHNVDSSPRNENLHSSSPIFLQNNLMEDAQSNNSPLFYARQNLAYAINSPYNFDGNFFSHFSPIPFLQSPMFANTPENTHTFLHSPLPFLQSPNQSMLPHFPISSPDVTTNEKTIETEKKSDKIESILSDSEAVKRHSQSLLRITNYIVYSSTYTIKSVPSKFTVSVTWAKCLSCGKQRKVPSEINPDVSRRFKCYMNVWDVPHNLCEKEEEKYNKNGLDLEGRYEEYSFESNDFKNRLFQFHNDFNGIIMKPCKVRSHFLDLYRFFRVVTAFGGFEYSLESKSWHKIYKGLEDYLRTDTSRSSRLKKIYKVYLLDYEKFLFKSSDDIESTKKLKI